MIFSSFEYFAFLAVVALSYWALGRLLPRWGKILYLTIASAVFYGWMMPALLVFLALSIGVNFSLGLWLTKVPRPKALPAAAVILNCLPLVFFKYTNFILSVIAPQVPSLKLILPLGISYITFVQIAFVVDISRGLKLPTFLDYAFHVAFWPKLVSGPITRVREIVPQITKKIGWRFNSTHVTVGLTIFFMGLAKKLLLADPLGNIVDWGWSSGPLDIATSWLVTASYTLQLYFDFSGYCDMAWGSAILFNIRLPINFNSPYKADSIQDFWRRWHISLSRWLRDYLYFTFGGSRCSLPKTLRNCFLTFLIGGIWHGAGWTFIVWGALHGAALSLCNLWKKLVKFRIPMPIAWLLTILFVHLAWVYFRAPDISSANHMIAAMFGLSGAESLTAFDWNWRESWFKYLVLAASVLALIPCNSMQIAISCIKRRWSLKCIICCGCVSALSLFGALLRMLAEDIQQTPFVYFQF